VKNLVLEGTPMDTKTEDAQLDAAVRDLSLIRGGPSYRIQQAARLIHPNEWNHVRRVTFAIAVGWLPLILITALFNPDSLVSLLKDYRVSARLLIAVPVLLVGQLWVESRFRMVVEHITKARLLETPDMARLDNLIAMLRRLRDSVIPELAILFLLVVHDVTSYKTQLDATPWLAHGVGSDLHLTAAGWYAVLVSATMFQFLLGLGLWKWLLWAVFAFKMSRLNLKLVPTHADGHGGLGFLGLTPIAFTPIAFAATIAIAATWRQEMLHDGANLMSFKEPAIVLAVIVALVALGPLAFFVPRLMALRRQGILDYGILGQIDSVAFHEKWIHRRAGHEAEFLTASENITLNNFSQIYLKLGQLKPFPADKGALITLAASVAVPLLPMILAVIPIATVLKALLKALR
jgi:hypothetical protein